MSKSAASLLPQKWITKPMLSQMLSATDKKFD